jgi:L-arabinonolactonase
LDLAARSIRFIDSIMTKTPITCVVENKDSLGEGCLWEAESQVLWWLDIARPSRIHRLNPASGAHRMWTSDLLLTAMARRGDGSFVLGAEDGVYTFDPVTGAISPFCTPVGEIEGNRFNDGACDSYGRFWLGSMQNNIGPQGEDTGVNRSTGILHRIDAQGRTEKMFEGIGVSNGPCWSPDDSVFYFSDSDAQTIYAFDFDAAEGQISNKRVLHHSPEYGYPDGATVDAQGFIWSARWDAACVLRIDPKGRIDRVVEIPAKRPTCVVFGGPKLDVIYVTSSCAHLDAGELAQRPLNGGVFCFDPGVKGSLKNSFAG